MGTLNARIQQLSLRLADERSRRVVFVSHCLLNQNVRYLGGAFRPGVVPEVLDGLRSSGAGICQMPCPEQVAWGGVMKRFILRFYGTSGTWIYRLRGMLLPIFQGYTRLVYRQLAVRVAGDIHDYVRSGFEVIAILGVSDSPSCGVCHTLDLKRSFPVLAACAVDAVSREEFNHKAVADCLVEGEGMYMQALRSQLIRRGLRVTMGEFDVFERRIVV